MMSENRCLSGVKIQLAALMCSLVLVISARNTDVFSSDVQCPNNTDDTLSLRSPGGQRLQDNVTGRAGHILDLHCCTSEQNVVTWYFRKGPEDPWTSYPWCICSYSIFPLPNTRNQTLRLKDPYLTQDAGQYRCFARQETTGQSVSHVVTVSLYSCVTKEKPEAVSVVTNQSVDIGSSVTYWCEGDFGCVTNTTRQREAYWRRGGVRLMGGEQGRYSVHNSHNLGHITLTSRLTITNIQPDDLGLPFECVLDTGQTSTTVTWSLQLKETARGTNFVLEEHWYVVMVIIILLLILICVIAWRLFGPQIHFFVKSTFCANHLMTNNNLPFDLAIWHSLDGDSSAVRFTENTLRTKLTGHGYTCATPNDLSADSLTLGGSGEIIRTSYSVVFVMTQIALEDPELHLLVNSALEIRHNVFCIALLDVNQSDSVTIRALKEKYRGLKILTWPTEAKSHSRQRKNFWSEMRLRLPLAKPDSPDHWIRISNLRS
ncbi:uncharacterized protein LOC135479613 [Liolophura sinensis]|uniref:uncharacterized protein LOC135479613 n=1 Tax=Liolophura sinensis TaxID=3198878 RepID=UPI0031586DD1